MLGPVHPNLICPVESEKALIKARGVNLVVLNERRSLHGSSLLGQCRSNCRETPSSAFSGSTPTYSKSEVGSGPFFRPAALSLAHVFLQGCRALGQCRSNCREPLHAAPSALLAKKMTTDRIYQIRVNRPLYAKPE